MGKTKQKKLDELVHFGLNERTSSCNKRGTLSKNWNWNKNGSFHSAYPPYSLLPSVLKNNSTVMATIQRCKKQHLQAVTICVLLIYFRVIWYYQYWDHIVGLHEVTIVFTCMGIFSSTTWLGETGISMLPLLKSGQDLRSGMTWHPFALNVFLWN